MRGALIGFGLWTLAVATAAGVGSMFGWNPLVVVVFALVLGGVLEGFAGRAG